MTPRLVGWIAAMRFSKPTAELAVHVDGRGWMIVLETGEPVGVSRGTAIHETAEEALAEARLLFREHG